MAVKTFNPSGASDNWSTASAWGGSLPVDGDSAIISSGKLCYMDTDLSGFATGLIAMTVNGTLSGPNGAGTGYIKMDGVAGHDITISSGGTIQHGVSQASPAGSTSIFKINLGTASEIKALGNDRTVKLYPTMKTIRHCNLISDAAAGSSAIVTDKTNAQLQADGWSVGDYISVCRPTTNSSPNQQLFTIQSWGGGSTINLSSTLTGGTYIAGSYVVNHTSNIMILTTRTSGSECAIDCGYYGPTVEIGANIVNTTCVTSYTNAGGYGIGQLANAGKSNPIYGTFHGLAAGINYSRGTNVGPAYFTGCTNAISRSVKANLDVRIFSCYGATSGLTSDCYITPESIVFGCSYSIGGMGNMQFAGKVKGCMEAFIAYSGSILATADIGGTAAIDKNQNGAIDFGDGGSIVLQGASIADTTMVFSYKGYVIGSNSKSCVAMYNYGGNYGQHWFFTAGGFTQPTTDAGFTALGYPSVEKMVFEWNQNLNFVDLPVDLVSGQPFYMVIDIDLGSTAYTWTVNPEIAVVDPSKPFESASAIIAKATSLTGGVIDTAVGTIQRMVLSFVPTPTANFPYGSHKPAILRVKGSAGNSSGTGTDYLLFAYTQSQSVVADVQSLQGSSTKLSDLISRIDEPVSSRFSLDEPIGTGEWVGTLGRDAIKAMWCQSGGMWEIDPVAKTLTLYAPDKVTPYIVFDLDNTIDLMDVPPSARVPR